MRRRLAPVVATGTVERRCGELIEPGSPWQLDHRDDGRGWVGPSHQRCNARPAGRRWSARTATANSSTRFRRAGHVAGSRSPAVGTEVFLGDGQVEVHVGRGIWERVVA
jgi:hypothetical protein